MPETTISKLEAAEQLLNTALRLLIDERDYVSAIVLAGSAEDLFQGMLEKKDLPSSRAQLASATLTMHGFLYPEEHPPKDREAFDMMRSAYNWLRHADKDDGFERRLDWKKEAVHIAMRAIDNLYALTGKDHPRRPELGYPLGSE
ncbi:hypothetical protein ACQ858_20975 [Variovorax ureilyticus]|uniref:hypothetical protein n=1 Tax=Variovorax ureilyticus TaxID=1836198 RepID=UPI003D66936D